MNVALVFLSSAMAVGADPQAMPGPAMPTYSAPATSYAPVSSYAPSAGGCGAPCGDPCATAHHASSSPGLMSRLKSKFPSSGGCGCGSSSYDPCASSKSGLFSRLKMKCHKPSTDCGTPCAPAPCGPAVGGYGGDCPPAGVVAAPAPLQPTDAPKSMPATGGTMPPMTAPPTGTAPTAPSPKPIGTGIPPVAVPMPGVYVPSL